jgi:hypothetical protein
MILFLIIKSKLIITSYSGNIMVEATGKKFVVDEGGNKRVAISSEDTK